MPPLSSPRFGPRLGVWCRWSPPAGWPIRREVVAGERLAASLTKHAERAASATGSRYLAVVIATGVIVPAGEQLVPSHGQNSLAVDGSVPNLGGRC